VGIPLAAFSTASAAALAAPARLAPVWAAPLPALAGGGGDLHREG